MTSIDPLIVTSQHLV